MVYASDTPWKLIDVTRMLSITASLGDARTTIPHPVKTSHGCLTDEGRASAGISAGLVGTVGGMEDIEDIKTDLLQGLFG